MYQGCIPKKTKNRRPIDEIAPKNKRCTWSQDTYMSVLMYQGYIPPPKKNRRPIDEIAPKKQKMYLVPRYVYVDTYVKTT